MQNDLKILKQQQIRTNDLNDNTTLTANNPGSSNTSDTEISEDESTANSRAPRSRSTHEIREELEVITEFDCHNISVETFITELKLSLANLPNRLHSRFIRLIVISKLIREPRQAIDGLELKTIDDLIAALRNEYDCMKSYDLAMIERNQCAQGRDDVKLFNRRFNTAHRSLKRTLANDSTIIQEHKAVLFANENRIALPQFIRGLKPSIRDKAQNYALEVEREEITTRDYDRKFQNLRTYAPQQHSSERIRPRLAPVQARQNIQQQLPAYQGSHPSNNAPRVCYHRSY
ncbi:hypothetical protein KPH14_001257 [Odynerus spinipes]|uniref:Uncharacterized protein n=1 Tax=Odynerus spinipes TaxID=1348599 RepID=A0AAD9VT92_9HYME|nr:hypothetical protein KPH14_001257 [Odynerus spinipes]